MSDSPTRIQILDDTTANQIAAGEVVERPAAVVKELVENSLDAGASRVLVELQEGGKYLIRVTDDGCGMGSADAVLALQRHATSKIATADDLFRITTMGFRGEALPSIASVSALTLTTRLADSPPEASGIELRCLGGTVEEVFDVGARTGTSITVENLFYNVPARLKFLKSTSTEVGHIVELVQRFSLSYPEVAFRLTHDDREIFTTPGNGGALDACVYVFGREIARQLAPLAYQSGSVQIAGFIGMPPTLRNTRAGQHTFVNRRFIRNKAVTRALDEAYKSVQTLHGSRLYPPAVIQIAIDPSLVDVNVSPTKTEVRFTREGEVYSSVHHAVREALLSGGLVATLGDKPSRAAVNEDHSFAAALLSVPSRFPVHTRANEFATPFRPAESDSGQCPDLSDPFEDKDGGVTLAPEYLPHPNPLLGKEREPDEATVETSSTFNSQLSTFNSQGADYRGRTASSVRILGQTRNTYILAQTDTALLVIDQHIAHERVLYERLVMATQGGGVAVQPLLLPFTLELNRREAMVVEKRLDELRLAGFELEPFGGDAFMVRSVPASVARKSLKAQGTAEAVLREIIEEMVEKTVSRKLLLPTEEVLITASCKMAVKAGDPLTFEEMEVLIADLFASENPYTCPHGRPIILEMSNGELDRKFGR